jgi:hypothetical protein
LAGPLAPSKPPREHGDSSEVVLAQAKQRCNVSVERASNQGDVGLNRRLDGCGGWSAPTEHPLKGLFLGTFFRKAGRQGKSPGAVKRTSDRPKGTWFRRTSDPARPKQASSSRSAFRNRAATTDPDLAQRGEWIRGILKKSRMGLDFLRVNLLKFELSEMATGSPRGRKIGHDGR